MSNIIKRLLGLDSKASKSSFMAEDRLKLILLHDRVNIPPQIMEKMRGELIEVISKYVDFDSNHLKVDIEEEDNLAVLVANITHHNSFHNDSSKSFKRDRTPKKGNKSSQPPVSYSCRARNIRSGI